MPRQAREYKETNKFVHQEDTSAGHAITLEKENELRQIKEALTADQITFSETLGAFSALTFVEKTVTIARIKMLMQWRDSKRFKGLIYFDPSGKSVTCQTFQDFCLALGLSYETANRYIQTFEVLGEEFMEAAQRMGIGITTMRQLGKLPQDEIEAAKLLIDTEGKEALTGFVADMRSKHENEKQKLQRQINEERARGEALERIVEKEKGKNTALETQIHRRETLPDLDLTEKQLQEMAVEAKLVVGGMNIFSARLAEVFDRDEPPQVLIDHACNMLTFMAQEILAIQSRFTLPIKLEEEMDPYYLTKLLKKDTEVTEG